VLYQHLIVSLVMIPRKVRGALSKAETEEVQQATARERATLEGLRAKEEAQKAQMRITLDAAILEELNALIADAAKTEDPAKRIARLQEMHRYTAGSSSPQRRSRAKLTVKSLTE
jgi:hypothetical protein